MDKPGWARLTGYQTTKYREDDRDNGGLTESGKTSRKYDTENILT